MVDHTQNDLWQAFFTEVSEQLDNLELILADPDAQHRADIHQLFRDFHTIKSSCAMMDFHSMERIAHASEDYLDIVRKGRATLNSNSIGMLLKGIDWLKSQLQLTRQSGEAPHNNSQLHSELLELSAQYAAANVSKPSHTDAPALPLEVHLSDDEITEFSSACKQELLKGIATETDPATAKRSINKMITICNLVGFTALSSLLKKYVQLKAANEIHRTQQTASDILDRLEIIESLYNVDCGSSALHAFFLDALFPDFAQSSGRLEFILDEMEEKTHDEDIIIQCETLLKALSMYASLFGFHQLKIFYRYTLQTIRSIRRGDIPDRKAAFYALRLAFDFPAAEQLHAGETSAFREMLETRQADLNVGIAQSLYSAGHDYSREHITQLIEIDSAILDLLMPASLAEFTAIAEARKPLFEIVIDMDCDPVVMDNIINTLTASATIIHNRSIFDQPNSPFSSSLSFLVAADNTDTSVADALIRLDANHLCHSCTALRYHSETPALTASKPLEKHAASTANNTTLRIESETLDNLVTQVGEMIMIRNRMSHTIHDPLIEHTLARTTAWLNPNEPSEHADTALDDSEQLQLQQVIEQMSAFHTQVEQVNDRMQIAINAIQARILDLRVIAISSVFDRIPQLVRKMADTQQKDICLIITGKEVRIDKGMVDILMEPLIHLVRNCIDHGIESSAERLRNNKPPQATLTLSAFQEGSTLVIKIADDGRGINVDVIRSSAIRKGFIHATDVLTDEAIYKLIFLPGFSTAEVITETSGRGVGMDVVINRINHIGGDIDVQSKPGNGTHFFLKLPLSAAIQGVVLVNTENRLYAIPQNSVMEVIAIKHNDIQLLQGQAALRLRDRIVPLFQLSDLILQRGIQAGNETLFPLPTWAGTANVMIMQLGSQRIAIIIDELAGREEVYMRGLHKDLRSLNLLSGAAVLSGGRLVFVLNSSHLFTYASLSPAFRLSQQQI